jgi:hypothetical protein
VRESQIRFDIARSNTSTTLEPGLSNVDVSSIEDIFTSTTSLFADHSIDGGLMSVDIMCRMKGSVPASCEASGSIDDLNLNGVNVAENVRATFAGDYSLDENGERIAAKFSFQQGAVYIEPGFLSREATPR